MLTAETYARAKGLMCESCRCCEECPLYGHQDERGNLLCCHKFCVAYPAEAVKIVHIWWDENKHKFPQYERKGDHD